MPRRALKDGDTVVIAGAVCPTGQILVSMLRELGLVPRPLVKAGIDAARIFGPGVDGLVYGDGEPLPATAAFVIADEKGVEGELIAAFIRQLAQNQTLTRVTLLDGRLSSSILGKVLGDSGDETRSKREALMKGACEQVGADWTIVRTGSLRGGGAGSKSPHSLGQTFYLNYPDSVQALEEELFDLKQLGIRTGDVVGSFFENPETSRLAAAAALAQSLVTDSSVSKDLPILSTEAKQLPDRQEWTALFEELAAAA